MNLMPLNEQVVVRLVEDEATTQGGLVLTTNTKINKGEVVAVCESVFEVSVGDVVLFTGRETTATGETGLLVMPVDEIVAVFGEEE